MVPTTTVNATTSSTATSNGTTIAATIPPSSSELSEAIEYSIFVNAFNKCKNHSTDDVGMHHVKTHGNKMFPLP